MKEEEPHYPSLVVVKEEEAEQGFWNAEMKRPDFVQPGNIAWWLSRWRPKNEIRLFPSRIGKEEKQTVKQRFWSWLEARGWVKRKGDEAVVEGEVQRRKL